MGKIIKLIGLYILTPIIVILLLWIVSTQLPSAPRIISKSSVAITAIEELSKLEILKYHLDLIIDETNKKDFLWIDQLYPDDRFLLSVSGEATACIDLDGFTGKNIKETGPNSMEITLPAPVFCGLPSIDTKTMKVHLKSGFSGDQFMEQNLQTLTTKLQTKAIESGLFTQAREIGAKNMKALLKPLLKEVQITIKFEELPLQN